MFCLSLLILSICQQYVLHGPVGSIGNTGTIHHIYVGLRGVSSSDGAIPLPHGVSSSFNSNSTIPLPRLGSTPTTLSYTEPISRSNSFDYDFVNHGGSQEDDDRHGGTQEDDNRHGGAQEDDDRYSGAQEEDRRGGNVAAAAQRRSQRKARNTDTNNGKSKGKENAERSS